MPTSLVGKVGIKFHLHPTPKKRTLSLYGPYCFNGHINNKENKEYYI